VSLAPNALAYCAREKIQLKIYIELAPVGTTSVKNFNIGIF
jgi:hypothetical protein